MKKLGQSHTITCSDPRDGLRKQQTTAGAAPFCCGVSGEAGGMEGATSVTWELLLLPARLEPLPQPTSCWAELAILGFSRARSSGVLSIEKKEAELSGVFK
jgi:hypothetical protein